MNNNNYNQYFHFDASSIPLRVLDRATKSIAFGVITLISSIAMPLLWPLVKRVQGSEPSEIDYPSAGSMISDSWRIATSSSKVSRAEVANGFTRFLDAKFGDLISIETPEKETYGTNIIIKGEGRTPEDKPHQRTTQTFNVQLEEYSFVNISRSGLVTNEEIKLQNTAITDQLAKVTKLLGGKVDEYGSYEIFSVADVQASKFKAQAIEQMKAIDANKAEIIKEIETLVKLSKGETLADAIIEKRDAARAHEPVVTKARDALDAERARPKGTVAELG